MWIDTAIGLETDFFLLNNIYVQSGTRLSLCVYRWNSNEYKLCSSNGQLIFVLIRIKQIYDKKIYTFTSVKVTVFINHDIAKHLIISITISNRYNSTSRYDQSGHVSFLFL